MATVAEQLHQGRELKRLSIAQVAQITKIRTDHLRALEEGNFNVFAAPVYIRGFVRTYSTLLKLDVPQVMAALEAELGQTRNFSEPPALSDRHRGGLDFLMLQLSKIDWRKGAAGLGLLILAGVTLIGLVAWRHARARDPLQGLKPGLYQATRTSGETLPLPPPKR